MYFFTADEHYGHENVIKYTMRPFFSVKEMDRCLIDNHNKVVKEKDVVIHAGDFTLKKVQEAQDYLSQLNGTHVFVKGGHDYWLSGMGFDMWQGKIEKEYIVVCHYAMRVWPRSHYGSWMLYGHSHGQLKPIGKQYDVGVDNNNFYPVSFNQLKEMMNKKEKTTEILEEMGMYDELS